METIDHIRDQLPEGFVVFEEFDGGQRYIEVAMIPDDPNQKWWSVRRHIEDDDMAYPFAFMAVLEIRKKCT